MLVSSHSCKMSFLKIFKVFFPIKSSCLSVSWNRLIKQQHLRVIFHPFAFLRSVYIRGGTGRLRDGIFSGMILSVSYKQQPLKSFNFNFAKNMHKFIKIIFAEKLRIFMLKRKNTYKKTCKVNPCNFLSLYHVIYFKNHDAFKVM